MLSVALLLLCSASFTGYAGQCRNAGPVNTANAALARTVEPVRWSRALLKRDKKWYSSSEAVRIADNLLLYQRDNGGWNKNTDMAKPLSREEEKALQAPAEKGGVATIDNGATFTQMEYLARVYEATGQQKYKEGFLRGLDYLLEAQYDNGGWPQFYPIRKGYYEHITFNDGAMMGVMQLLRNVALNKAPYAFVDAPRKELSANAVEKGLDVILKSQVKVNGKLTAWCAQHNHITLAPANARAYELVSLSGGESLGIIKYLMALEKPSPEVIRAVDAAVSWTNQVKITGIRLKWIKDATTHTERDRIVVTDPTAPPLLARFYEIGTNKPMFVGRDGIVHEKLAEIEQERRSGYSWYIAFSQELVEQDYPAWKRKWAVTE
ncbi:PelA/Pel-15E family pectate lyase [Pontibacter ummariensis]|uniref:Pectate lyase, PelA/Pel-15E family n=2 Tax=Pontibacter ummariensis TaxID=1610492 RepID=A0A239H387_9BACT|nr:PelA/Pel-15E family pectate lyase [Pontibacter ummariensis]SNS75652.1 pectate lyase, PelA/Pel-15E family [Pontibacter ummariensis]